MAHARLGPSNHRWVHCPGSVREESEYHDTAGAAAIDGTGSHLLLEMCLDNNVRADAYVGQIIGANDPENPMGWLVEEDRCERVQMCLDYVTRRSKELSAQYPGAEVIVEAESYSDPGGMFGRTDWWGTVDITLTVRDKAIVYFVEAVDYKDGRGWVAEKNNSQLLSYVIGKIRPYIASGPDLVRPFRPERVFGGVRMTIVQPKTNPVVRYQDMLTGDVVEWAIELCRAADATDAKDAPLISGKHCQWCKHNPKRGGSCNAEAQKSLETVSGMSNEIIATTGSTSLHELMEQVLTDVEQMPAEQLAQLADAKSGLMAAFDRVDKEIENRLKQELPVPGYAMRPGRGTNVWNGDEEAIAKALKGRRLKKDQIYPAKLLSPAQMMKLEDLNDKQKQTLWDEFVTHTAGKSKLTRVGIDEVEKLEKEVGQSETSVQQSPAEMMFADVANTSEKEPAAVAAPISFL